MEPIATLEGSSKKQLGKNGPQSSAECSRQNKAGWVFVVSLALLGCSKSADESATAYQSQATKQEIAATTASPQAPEPAPWPDYVRALPFQSVAMHRGALALSEDGTVAAHVTIDGTIVVWDPHTFEALESIPPEGDHRVRPATLALSADGRLLAIGRRDSVIVVRSRNESKVLRELRGHSGAILALAFSPDGRLLASGGHDATTVVWDLSTGSRLHVFDSKLESSWNEGVVVGLGFSGDARALVVNEWYFRQAADDFETGTTIWDLVEGIEIGTRDGPEAAVGGSNWLLAYTTREGLAVDRLDACEMPHIRTGAFANTVADPQGRWVAAHDNNRGLLFYAVAGDAAPVRLALPVRPIALVPSPEGQVLFVLAVKEPRADRDEYWVSVFDMETVPEAAVYAISIPDSLRELPPLMVKREAERCPPSANARRQWSYRLTDKIPALNLKARIQSPGKIVMPHVSNVDNNERFSPPKDFNFADDGTLYVLYEGFEGQHGVVAWDPVTSRILRSHFGKSFDEPLRLPNGWAARLGVQQYVDMLTGQVLLESSGNGWVKTDADTGEIYKIVDGRIERYNADGKPQPPLTREGLEVMTAGARNGNLVVMYHDGTGERWNTHTGKSWPRRSLSFGHDPICEIHETPLLSPDGRFGQFAWDCTDAPTDYVIADLSTATRIARGPVLGAFPKRSARVVVPDARANQLDIWDLSSGELLARLPRQPSRSKNGGYRGLIATISDDGRLVASASFDGLVRVWDIDTKHVVGEATVSPGEDATHDPAVTSLLFDPSGRTLAVGAASGQVLIFDVVRKAADLEKALR